MGLREARKVKVPLQEFDSEQVRYEHRFFPFHVVMTPPPVHYDQFLSMTDLSNFPQVIYYQFFIFLEFKNKREKQFMFFILSFQKSNANLLFL